MLIALLLVFLLAGIAPVVHKKGNMLTPVFFATLTAGLVAYFFSFYSTISAGDTVAFSYSWAASVSVDIAFYLDGLSLFFALLVSSFGVLILLYSAFYMKEYEQANRFFGVLIFFMGSMLGMVLSANLICFFIFWELTSFSSYLLIGFNHKNEKARKAAHQAWLLTASGGLAVLAGIILTGMAGDTYTISELLSKKDIITESPYLTAIVLLLLAGAFTKSAQFPFHFWLPNAMEAPTPVSAYLHSATMVKAGVYLVFRLNGIFSGVELWQTVLAITGGFTMLMASIVAFRADDLKRILAFSTISALGIFFMMIGLGSKEAGQAAMVYVLAHAMYKAALFLVAGILDHECGTRKISELSQIPKKMPYTFSAAVLASLSMAGVIPFIGFTGKELLYKAALHHQALFNASIAALVLSSAFFVAICLKLVVPVFLHKSARAAGKKTVQEAPALMFVPPFVLGILAMLIGLFPEVGKPLLEIASNNMLNVNATLDLSLWHGFNTIFMLSLITLLLGASLYFVTGFFIRIFDALPFSISAFPEQVYEVVWKRLLNLGGFLARVLQSGILRNYITIYVVTLGLLILYYLFHSGFIYNAPVDLRLRDLQVYEVAVLALVVFTVSFIFLSRSRLAIIASIGITGFGIALAYALFSAPDVAITQFLVETLGLILLAIILPNLPRLKEAGLATKKKYLFISAAFGLLMAYITLVTMSHERESKLKRFFLEKSVPLGKGENAVNVILVDFRALDTLGEISVLVITMVGIIAFLVKRKQNSEL